MSTIHRREFLKNTGKASVAIGLGTTVLNVQAAGNKSKHLGWSITYTQQPLPCAYNALEPMIDAMTMEIHYSKHAANYCKNLKEAAQAESADMKQPLEVLLGNISKYSVKLRNNGGGHYNHEMFWKCMRPKSENNKPSGDLLKALEDSFGNFENFKSQFTEAGKTRFGSGWAWLYMDASKKLKVGSTANQDNPLMDTPNQEHKGFPLLCIDVWEHAYYLKYQNKRADYIENCWKLVNWNYVESRFTSLI
jgi:Fe-Mn family superoxide dismutase